MAQTGIPSWSKTANDNGNADPDINWAEGMAPSAVNNSARAMMAAVAEWRDDNSGALTTGGTSTAYTVATNQGFDSLSSMNGQTLRLKFNATNGASPTLNVDSLGAKAIHAVGGTAVGAAAILANGVYDLVYDNSNNRWVLVGGDPSQFASGTRLVFQQNTAPAGWTRDTDDYNDYAIRVTNGTVGTGGSANFSTVFASRTIAQNNLPNATLTVTGSVSTSGTALGNAARGWAGTVATATNSPNPTGAAPSSDNMGQINFTSTFSGGVTSSLNGNVSQQGMDFAVKYADVIFAEKD